jgi:hypothetical protein
MKPLRHLALLALGFSVLACAFAQPSSGQLSTAQGAKSDQIQIKARQVELLVQLVPLAMTKEQIRALLPTIEKVRSEQRTVLSQEDAELAKLEARLDAAIKNALEKGSYPPPELLVDVLRVSRALRQARQINIGLWVDLLIGELKKVLNAGQMTVMEKSVEPKLIDPNAKDEDWTTEKKQRFFIQSIFLDPLSYELLVKMSR